MQSHGNTFCIAGPLWGKSIGYHVFPSQRASNVDLWYLLLAWTSNWTNSCQWFQIPWFSCDITVMLWNFIIYWSVPYWSVSYKGYKDTAIRYFVNLQLHVVINKHVGYILFDLLLIFYQCDHKLRDCLSYYKCSKKLSNLIWEHITCLFIQAL